MTKLHILLRKMNEFHAFVVNKNFQDTAKTFPFSFESKQEAKLYLKISISKGATI